LNREADMQWREFRSDTMTRPSAAMRRAMAEAEVGDDVCGDDPTVNRLEAMAAQTLGKEAALFVPSGVFGNQCAIGVHCRPGDEAIVSEKAHVVEHEAGGAAALSGVQIRAVMPANGHYLTADDIQPRIRVGDDIHIPRTALILLENALSDGSVMPLTAMQDVAALARAHAIPVHLDGARIFNAALALDVDPMTLAACCDTVSFCLSKGLGAPVGSLLCGPRAFVDLARRRRKVMGGGMRQVGVLAAPGILALTQGPAGLALDHARARRLAEGLAAVPGLRVNLQDVVTNMVYVRLDLPGRTEPDCVAFLLSRGIRVYPPLPDGIRFVTSLEVGDDDIAAAIQAMREFAQA
jgi:threonine aldolase